MDNSVRKVTTQIRKDTWMKNISDRNASGLTIRQWCNLNNVNETSYYYWLKKVRREIIDSTQLAEENDLAFVPMLLESTEPNSSQQQRNKINTTDSSEITIKVGDMTIEFGKESSQELILNVLKVLKNA
ncbi:IS66 family insertion sequence element accessory protein TnpA [Acetoanaerobium sticklandii]|uniref:IS66 family insertion sequence element accessory protein TnpA n=1 Tax=Acetoanaerobium sticklandii TaxID=1511 RepID=UPI003A91E4A1